MDKVTSSLEQKDIDIVSFSHRPKEKVKVMKTGKIVYIYLLVLMQEKDSKQRLYINYRTSHKIRQKV